MTEPADEATRRAVSPPALSEKLRAAAPKLVLSLAIAGAFVWVLQHGGLPLVPDAEALAHMAWWTWPVAILTHGLVTYYRTCRWIHLLRPIAPNLSARRVLGIGFVGFTAIIFAPLRTGEFVRPYLLSRDGEVTFTQALGATAAERIIDGLIVSTTLFVALLFVTPLSPLPDHIGDLRIDVAVVPTAAFITTGFFFCAFAVLLSIHRKGSFVHRSVDRLVGALSPKAARFVSAKLELVADGLQFLPSVRHVAPFLRDTVIYYIALAVGYWAMIVGCGLPATMLEGWVVVGILSIGILLPAGPGFFGAYQIACYAALAMFFPADAIVSSGAAFVFVSYSGQLIVTVLSCLVGLVLMRAYPANEASPSAVWGLARR